MKNPSENAPRASPKQTSSAKCSLLTFIYSLITLILILLFFQIHTFQSPLTSFNYPNTNRTPVKTLTFRLKNSITFLPLKDLRFEKSAMDGHTWFMSSLNDTYKEDEPEYLQFPSEASKGRILCFKGRDERDGAKNEYALAWSEYLPDNSTLLPGLTYISDTYYDYENLWHSLSPMIPFVHWHEKGNCEVPERWVLFHWGEVRKGVGNWIGNLMEATFGERMKIEGLRDGVVCFEKSVVFRHGLGKMGKENRFHVFDMLRCKARSFCNVGVGSKQEVRENGVPVFGFTLLLRTGARGFKNESEVVRIFEEECGKVDGCKFRLAMSENLSFCDQVEIMSYTDILASPHGAQMTNLFFMDRGSSVMEFYPRGWLELAGPGQYVFQWLATWSGMNHQGSWRDQDGEECPKQLQQHASCFTFYKVSQIGHNHTFFSNWAKTVINEMKKKKLDEGAMTSSKSYVCPCS